MTSGPDPDLDRLFYDGAWLRSFARSLVPARDVDDLVQSTWLAALQQRAGVRRPQHWLRGAAKNLARMLHRQRVRAERRESRSLPTEPAPSTADLVAGLEVQREVSEALLALPEPVRSILVLRYHEGLEPAAIAKRLGLQAAAVRQRLHRGRELVRARLQQRFGNDWRGNSVVLAFAGSVRQRTTTVTAFASISIATAACAFVVGIADTEWISTGASPIEPATMATLSPVANPVERGSPLRADAPAARLRIASITQDTQQPASTTAVEVRGRIVAAEDGQPLAGAKLTTNLGWRSTTSKAEQFELAPVTTSADGRFAVICPPAAVSLFLWIAVEGRCQRWYDASPPRAIDLGDVPMTRGHAVRGRLVDETGRPMPGVRVT
ncbi:MAG: sigma-70 family RNA polymerase sigma factor, partial [Planctomycetota bacterium]